MAQAMPRPPVLLIIDTFPQQRWFSILGFKEKCVALRRNSKAVKLALLSGFRVEVVIFNFQNGTGDHLAVVGIECFELRDNLTNLFPR